VSVRGTRVLSFVLQTSYRSNTGLFELMRSP
jgi:hypothetical protein